MAEIVTVYVLPNCVQCTMTKRALDAAGIRYQVVDLSVDDAAHDLVSGLGYRSAPVVVTGSDSWAGFRPDKIAALAAYSPATSETNAGER